MGIDALTFAEEMMAAEAARWSIRFGKKPHRSSHPQWRHEGNRQQITYMWSAQPRNRLYLQNHSMRLTRISADCWQLTVSAPADICQLTRRRPIDPEELDLSCRAGFAGTWMPDRDLMPAVLDAAKSVTPESAWDVIDQAVQAAIAKYEEIR